MDLSLQINFSAPAYIVRGGADTLPLLFAALEARGVAVHGNPDCRIETCDTLSVDQARSLSSFAALKSVGAHKYVIVVAESMTPEAQNALLKSVEEGNGNTLFFFIVPSGAPVLPTLVSRAVTIKNTKSEVSSEAGESFLTLSYGERMALAEAFTKNHDREGARSLVRSLITLQAEHRFNQTQLRDLLSAEQFLALSGSSPKSVIGHLALVL